MNKVVFVNVPQIENFADRINAICDGRWEVDIISGKISKEEFVKDHLPGAEVIVGLVFPDWLETAQELKWVQAVSAGVNAFAGKKLPDGMLLTNASGAFGDTIAEHSMSMILSLARRIPAYVKNTASGTWHDLGTEWALKGKTALVLGTGDLGTCLADKLKAFGMKVIGVCRTNDSPRAPYDEIVKFTELDRVLPIADAVCGCLPSTADTVKMLNADRLGSMKDDSILINVGRGDLIDTETLTKLLSEGKFFGVGLDVTDPEPLPADHPLWKFDNVVITPHVAGISFGHLGETQSFIIELILENLKRFRDGQELRNLVDISLGY